MGLLVRLAGAASGLWIADAVWVGIELESWGALWAGALVLGLAHALVRPVLTFVTAPLTILTLGLSLWAINAALLWGAAWLVPGFVVRGVAPALLGALVISAVAGLAHALLGPEEDVADG